MTAHRFFSAHPSPRCGQRQDRLGTAAGGLSFRTSAYGLLSFRVSRWQAASTPCTFPPTNPRIRLFRSLPLRPAPHSAIESACACGFGSLSTVLQEHIRLSPLHRVSASQVPLTPDCCSLLKPNAQQVVLQRLMAYHGTLNAFNRLVLHSRPLQARRFAAAASRVVGGLHLPEVLHYATCTPSSSPPFEHLPASPLSAEAGVCRRNRYCVSVRRHASAFLPNSRF